MWSKNVFVRKNTESTSGKRKIQTTLKFKTSAYQNIMI